ncbi:endonuclease/exonuclease/phosphatase family protein [Demequina sp.]|uniref:endonuclease/exonuclease/phosphatase family protein n=1 Tax=Demequina sp. TaxID=2050685 RepID=UPI0025B90516|nr:endonuclease/exonuclease/phosphatase family protein [Demequina sp.]
MDETADAPPTATDDAAVSRRRRRAGWHLWVWWLALVGLVAVLVPVVARLTGWEAGPLAWLVALMPWVTLACVVPLVLAVLARSWSLSVTAAAITSLGVAWMVPLYVAAPAAGDTVLTVATLNLEYGEADADAVVRLVEDYSVDVLAVQELTPAAVTRLRDAGLEEVLPQAVLAPEPGFKGTGLWSRLPLADRQIVDALSARAVRAQITVESRALAVYAIHPEAPALRSHQRWSEDMDRLAALLGDVTGGVIVAGDFNTARDHAAFRRLEGLGYADAADQAGAGFQPTFPEGRTIGPLVAIDHVMTRDASLVAKTLDTVAIPGTDHRALVAGYVAD